MNTQNTQTVKKKNFKFIVTDDCYFKHADTSKGIIHHFSKQVKRIGRYNVVLKEEGRISTQQYNIDSMLMNIFAITDERRIEDNTYNLILDLIQNKCAAIIETDYHNIEKVSIDKLQLGNYTIYC